MIHNAQSSLLYNLSLQTYALHPFIDVYGRKCDKGMAVDYVISKISNTQRKEKIMYLGDSDNDNPAFTKNRCFNWCEI
jgi:predicted mannosyl-3-phosphoglycerate phosphatase (HAD superfamily)